MSAIAITVLLPACGRVLPNLRGGEAVPFRKNSRVAREPHINGHLVKLACEFPHFTAALLATAVGERTRDQLAVQEICVSAGTWAGCASGRRRWTCI